MEGQSNCRTLEELLDSLDPNLFWRAHRSYLVNINRIKEVVPWFKSSYQIRMEDKKQTEIPVSRAQTKRLRIVWAVGAAAGSFKLFNKFIVLCQSTTLAAAENLKSRSLTG